MSLVAERSDQPRGADPSQPQTSSKEPSSVRLALTLGVAGLVSGLALVLVYEATLPLIEAHKARALRAAVFKVLPGATQMQKLVPTGERLRPAPPDSQAEGVYAAYDDAGQFVGYAIEGAGAGFQDTIRLIFGFDVEHRRIVGMEVLESRETPGLGDKIYKDDAFRANFRALAVEPKIEVVKPGEGTADNQVDAITGATISSKAVVRIVDEAHTRWAPQLPSAADVPPLAARREGETR
jgi:electron transport complex protein RnfG